MTAEPLITRPLVLVVDDDSSVQFVLKESLEMAGFQVEQAFNGSDAIRKFPQVRPDLVLMDVMMPDMDGFATCAALRRSLQGLQTPVVFLTSLDDTASVNAAYEAGATDFMVKPLNPFLLGHRARYLLRATKALRELEKSREHLASAQQLAHVGSWEWDAVKGEIKLSDVASQIFGVSTTGYRGAMADLLPRISPSVRTLITSIVEQQAIAAHPYHEDHRITLNDGVERVVHIQARAVPMEDGRTLAGLMATVQDITERKRLEEHVHHLAYYDSLTGLPNRLLFRDRAQQALAYARRHTATLAIFFLDIDRFKFINDTYGHTAGDLLLKQIAERLTEVTRASDSVARPAVDEIENAVARLGGDEFTILLTGLRHAEHATTVARRILAALAAPFSLEGREVFVTGSIGIALSPGDGETLEELLKNADTAMYEAKNEGRNNYQYYSRSMNAMAGERLALENELRRAVERQEFRLYYQPFLNIHTGHVAGAEALIRWAHPTRGILAPAEFLPVIDDIGLSHRLGQWILETACRQAAAWNALGHRSLRIGINLSNAQFQDHRLSEQLARMLQETGVPPGCIELELTETIVMPHPEEAVALLQQFKAMGLRLALDDFGTGYSSISHLRTLPIDTVKIDRSFIVDVAKSVEDAAIAEAMISMAHTRHMQVLAEGIETTEQLALLRRLGCDEMQGYLFSKAVAAEEFPSLLDRRVIS